MAMLEVTNLGISFGGLRAVDELSMKIEKGSLVGLIGPNGAGKTTVFNMLTGVYRPTDGGIRLDGENLVGKKPHDICRMGVARTFQNIRLFPQQSVLDNVKSGLHNQVTYSLPESMLHLGSYHRKEKMEWLESLEEVYQEIIQRQECISLKTLAVSGKDLIDAGMKPGREIGETLNRFFEIVLEEPEKNTKEYLLSLL